MTENRRITQARKNVANETKNVARIEAKLATLQPGDNAYDRVSRDLVQQRAQLDFAIKQLGRALHEPEGS